MLYFLFQKVCLTAIKSPNSALDKGCHDGYLQIQRCEVLCSTLHIKSGIRKAAPRIQVESLTLCNFYSCPLSAQGHFTLTLCQWR